MIGVVGGVGPYAGMDLVKNIFDNTIANTDQEHLPLVMLNLPETILDRTEFLLGIVHKNPGEAIAGVLLKMEKIGATVAGIPCNTAHADEIFDLTLDQLREQKSEIKLLNLIDEAVNMVKQRYPDLTKVGFLSTTGTARFGIYQKALLAHNLQSISVDQQMQEELIHPAIYSPEYGIKSKSNPIDERARQSLLKGMVELKKLGAEIIIKGCTEIAMAIPENELLGIPLIDPSKALARALIAAVDENKL